MSADLKSRLRGDLNRARKDRDRLRTLVLSTTLSEIRNREIEIGKEAGDQDVLSVLSRAVKQRHEASEQMRAGGRTDLAEREEEEARILTSYLPPPLTEAEVRSMVREAIDGGVTQMGPIMGALMPRIRGRFDGKEANRIVREELQA